MAPPAWAYFLPPVVVGIITIGYFIYQSRHLKYESATTSNSDSFVSTPHDNCPICLFELQNNEDMRYLSCGHAMHKNCYELFINARERKCPNCRVTIILS